MANVEFKSIRALARAMGGIPDGMRRELRPAVREAGQMIADQAKRNASWSTRIPGAISVRTSFAQRRGGARVVVDRKKAPHARPYEGIGSRGKTTFRHPVFADADHTGGFWSTSTWVEQSTRPFLVPAVASKKAAATDRIRQAIQSALNVRSI